LDDIIEFHAVSKDMLADIITIQLENFRTFVQKEKSIALQFDDSVINMLAERWRDPEYGVRPLKRAIQRHIVDELALYLLEHHIEEWSSIITYNTWW
jgi:ATP-dependent Clp protease ATP-binding subunit ClpB